MTAPIGLNAQTSGTAVLKPANSTALWLSAELVPAGAAALASARRRMAAAGPLHLGAGALAFVALYLALAVRPGFAVHGVLPLLAVFVAATASSIAGFAFSAMCGALLFHLLGSPIEVVQILLLCSIVNQTLAVAVLWRNIVWSRLLPFLVAGAAGVPLGGLLLLHSDPRAYIQVFGVLLIAYSLYMLFRRPTTAAAGTGAAGDWIVGFLGGVVGGFAAFPGAPVSIWVGFRGWDKLAQRAVFQPFILIMQLAALVAMQLLGRHTGQGIGYGPAVLTYLPLSLLGTWCGLAVFKRLSDRQFAMIVNLLLIVSGIAMVA
jgi:uncharacterized membrane protein YfcA